MKIYNKLVRDKIPEIIQRSGEIPKTHILVDDQQYLKALAQKLIEESNEVAESLSLEELADVLEVVISIGEALGLSFVDIENARLAKEQTRGGFTQRIFLESTE